jgi:hypothetical protein
MSHVPRILAALVLPAVVLIGVGARAQTPEYLVNDDTDGEAVRSGPSLVTLENGRVLALWSDNAFAEPSIRSRILSASLDTLTTPALVNTDEGEVPHTGPVMSQPNAGRIAATWFDGREQSDETDTRMVLYAQLFSSADGSRVGGNLRLGDDQALGDQVAPEAAVSASGMTLACWSDNRSGVFRIFGQRISADGALVGRNVLMLPNDTAAQRNPALSPLPGGGFLLAWDEVAGQFHQVFYVYLGEDAVPLGAPRAIANATGFEQEDPGVLVRSQDALIAWTDNREGTSDIWGQWLTLSGERIGSNLRLRQNQDSGRDDDSRLIEAPDESFALTWFGGYGNSQRALVRFFGPDRSPRGVEVPMSDPAERILVEAGSATPLAAGRWMLAWSDSHSLTDQVYLDLADPFAGPAGNPRPVWTVPGSAPQVCGDVAFFPGGRAVVVWGDARNDGYAVMARFLDANGQPADRSFQVNSVPTSTRFVPPDGIKDIYPFAPSVAASPLGTFVVTFTVDSGGGRRTLYGQLFDAGGQPIGQNFYVSHVGPVPPTHPQFDPRPAMGRDGHFIAWRDDFVESNGDIYLQRYSPAGDTLGPPVLVPESEYRNSPQQSPAVAISPYDDMVVAWVDGRRGGWDIFRQRLDPSGGKLDPKDVQVSRLEGSLLDQRLNPSVATNGSSIVTVWDERPLNAGLINGRLEILESAAQGPATPQKSPARLVDFTVNANSHPRGIKYPRVAMEASGRFVVVWSDFDHGRTHVWAQRFSSQAEPIGHSYPLNEADDPGYRVMARAAANPNRIQYVWTDSRRGQGWDIYSHNVSWVYTGDPNPVEPGSFAAVSTARGLLLSWWVPLDQRAPSFRIWRDDSLENDSASGEPPSQAILLTPEPIQSGTSGLFTYEDDSVPPGTDVRYYLEGSEVTGGMRFYGPFPARLDLRTAAAWTAEPNPFRASVVFRAPAKGPVRLEVWDASGRRIRTLERGPSSDDPLLWDGRDSRGRAVPCGTYLVRPVPLDPRDARAAMTDPAWRTIKLTRVR